MPLRISNGRAKNKKVLSHAWLVHLQGNEKSLRRFLSEHPAEIQGVSREGRTFTLRVILHNDILERVRADSNLRYLRDTDLTALGQRVSMQVGEGVGFDQVLFSLGLTLPAQVEYLSCAAVAKDTADLANAFSDLCELIDLPEPSYEGTACKAISIGKKAPAGAPAILILGGIHGREWGSCEIALHFAEQVLATYSKPGTDMVLAGATFPAAAVKALVETRQLVVFPLVNPDGRAYSQEGWDLVWRKNRRPIAARGDDPGDVGVDINRNFGFLFDLHSGFQNGGIGLQVSSQSADELFQGRAPFSEPETRNVRSLFERFPATSWLVDLHSSSQTVMCPWSVDDTQTDDANDSFLVAGTGAHRGLPGDTYEEFMRLEDRDEHLRLRDLLAQGIQDAGGPQYARKTGFSFSPCPGTSHDYAYSRHLTLPGAGKVLGFVIEWGTSPYPEWVDMQKILPQVAAGLMRFAVATQHPLP